jgi:hypothetical protein
MNRPNPRMPRLATACCAIFSLAALAALLIHHTYFTFCFGFGFFAVVMIVWLLNWRSS